MMVLTDGVRAADADNPNGYYELEGVKGLRRGDIAWLVAARGRAVKIVSALLPYLPGQVAEWPPSPYAYEVILMERQIDEILASQGSMLERRGRPTDEVNDAQLAGIYGRHLQQVAAGLAKRPDTRVLRVSYNAVQAAPQEEAERVDQFLGGALDAGAMAGVVRAELYRQRRWKLVGPQTRRHPDSRADTNHATALIRRVV